MLNGSILYGTILIICLFVTLQFFIFSLKYNSLGYKLLSICCFLDILMFLGEFYQILAPGVQNKLFGMAISEMGYSLIPIAGLCFALYLLKKEEFIRYKYLILVSIIPLIGVIGSFINCFHPIFYTVTIAPNGFVETNATLLYNVIFTYSILFAIVDMVLVIIGIHRTKNNKIPFILILIVFIIPTATSLFASKNFIPLSYLISIMFIGWVISGYDILDLSVVHQEFMDYANVGLLFFNEKNKLIEFNKFFKKRLMYDDLDFNQSVEEVFKHGNELQDFFYSDANEIVYFSNSTNHWFKISKNNVYDGSRFRGYLFIFEDITSEIEKQESLKQRYNEVELLIRESNHRMKNNLNLLLRFISLEKRFNKEDPEKIIEHSIGRIESLSILHEKLYNADNLKDINVKEYLNSLSIELDSLFSAEGNIINYGSNDEDLVLSSEKLIPLSLMLTELLINSFKYAFDDYDVDDKIIDIYIGKFDDKIMLHYSDNGKGLPDGFDPSKNKGLGWMIIQALSDQLDGEYEVFNDGGMNFKLTFGL